MADSHEDWYIKDPMVIKVAEMQNIPVEKIAAWIPVPTSPRMNGRKEVTDMDLGEIERIVEIPQPVSVPDTVPESTPVPEKEPVPA